ncbi:MAG: hypothetical protein HMLKMBBP_03790 [Planctomycetes bacterium]|nr:hypothetical protein [Planctomycetota bacterium]
MRARVLPVVALAALLGGVAGVAAAAAPATPTRVPNNLQGGPPDDSSSQPVLSKDGRFVAFSSSASDLVEGDTNGQNDVFVLDTETGDVTRVSVSSAGEESNGSCNNPGISENGRWVLFDSDANNLVPDDTNDAYDVFVHDRKTGVTRRVSVATDGTEASADSDRGSMSGKGRWIAFAGDADNLVPDDTNGETDAFLHDLKTGRTIRASVGPDGEEAPDGASDPQTSKTGRYVAFATRSDEFGAREGSRAPIVRDMKTGRLTIGAQTHSGGAVGSTVSFWRLASNGKSIAFASGGDDVTPAGNPSGQLQVYWMSLRNPSPVLLSRSGAGAPGSGQSIATSISPTGRLVAFRSLSPELVEGDVNGVFDIFLAAPSGGDVRAMSRNGDGALGNDHSFTASLSANGKVLAFSSAATNLDPADTNGNEDIYLVSTR